MFHFDANLRTDQGENCERNRNKCVSFIENVSKLTELKESCYECVAFNNSLNKRVSLFQSVKGRISVRSSIACILLVPKFMK